MKIALITSSYHPYNKGGGEYSVKELAEGLLQKKQDVFVITAFHKNKTEYIDGVKVYRIKHPNIYWSYTSGNQSAFRKAIWHIIEGCNFRVKKHILPILKGEKPDVVHIRNSEDFSPYVCKVIQEQGIPNVVSLNSYTWLCPKATMFRNGHNCEQQCLDCKLITTPKKYLSKYVDFIAGASQFTLSTHTKSGYFSNAKQQVVYTSTKPKEIPLPFLKQEFLTLGYIGRIHPTKGVDKTIASFLSLKTDKQVRLLIAGDGPDDYVQHCRQLAKAKKNILFLGKVEAEVFFKQVDIVIINSLWHEPFPRVLVEAYAYGRPVIAATTGGTPEMVIDNKTGLLFDAWYTDELTEKMETIIAYNTNQILQLNKNIKAFFANCFHNSTQQYLNLYHQLIKVK